MNVNTLVGKWKLVVAILVISRCYDNLPIFGWQLFTVTKHVAKLSSKCVCDFLASRYSVIDVEIIIMHKFANMLQETIWCWCNSYFQEGAFQQHCIFSCSSVHLQWIYSGVQRFCLEFQHIVEFRETWEKFRATSDIQTKLLSWINLI